ncbi:MAG TPA: hypothetical protein VFB63_09615 [Bryobacteraceae bacterium]|nr:hypothetical protein [Bryobacteraceae bacterium]
MRKKTFPLLLVVMLGGSLLHSLHASGHGPVFGLATPTNPKGGWSLDFNLMGRTGDGSGVMFRPALGYGVTENFKVAVSAPVGLKTEPFAPSRMSAFTSMSGDFEGTAIWRFHRKDTGIGSRFESAAIAGVLLPSPQDAGGPLKNVGSAPGALMGGVTGVASRSHYAWGGATYQRYASNDGDRRPDLLFYTLAYAYRPPSWRTDTGWDWRIFGEMTGERTGEIQRSGLKFRGTDSHQIFLGPTTLGVYKNYAVSAGIQFPVYRASSPVYARERFRFALNFAYFF